MTGIQQTVPAPPAGGRRFRAYTAKHLDELTARAGLAPEDRLAVRAVGTVLPFRTNAYVVDELIDWDAAPDDPIYRLVFPQADMLPADDVRRIAGLLARGAQRGWRSAPRRTRYGCGSTRIRPASWPSTSPISATSRCPEFSTSTPRRC